MDSGVIKGGGQVGVAIGNIKLITDGFELFYRFFAEAALRSSICLAGKYSATRKTMSVNSAIAVDVIRACPLGLGFEESG